MILRTVSSAIAAMTLASACLMPLQQGRAQQPPSHSLNSKMIGKQNGVYNNYRFHDDDPLFFSDGLRLTCRNGETEHGTLEGPVAYMMPAQTRFTTYAWLYQW